MTAIIILLVQTSSRDYTSGGQPSQKRVVILVAGRTHNSSNRHTWYSSILYLFRGHSNMNGYVPTRERKQRAFGVGFCREKGVIGCGIKNKMRLIWCKLPKYQNRGSFGVNWVNFEWKFSKHVQSARKIWHSKFKKKDLWVWTVAITGSLGVRFVSKRGFSGLLTGRWYRLTYGKCPPTLHFFPAGLAGRAAQELFAEA